MADAGIVRSNAKIDAAINGAKIYLAMRDRGEDFSEFCWGFVDGKPIQNRWTAFGEVPAKTPLAVEVVQGAEGQGLQVRRPGDRLRLDAGGRHGQRPLRRLPPARCGEGT